VHGGADHCTVRYHMIEGMIDLPLAFWDTWGVAPERYNGNELELIMNGKLPAGWEMDENVALAEETDEATAEENRPHAVIFMLPVAWLGDPESEQMQKIISEFTKVVRLGVNPLVLLARVDEIEPTIRNDPSQPGQEVQKAVKQAAKLLGIPDANVIANVNYLEEHKKSFEIDRNLWIILHRVLSQSKHYLEYLQHQSKQAAAKRDQGAPLIRQKLNEAEKLRDDYLKRATTCEQEVNALKVKSKQLKQRVDELSARLTQETSDKQTAVKFALFWRSVFMTSLVAVVVATLVLNPAARAYLSSRLLMAIKRLAQYLETPATPATTPPATAVAPPATTAAPAGDGCIHGERASLPSAASTLPSPESSYIFTHKVAADGSRWMDAVPNKSQ